MPTLLLAGALLVLASLWTLAAKDELSLGRKPWQNLQKTLVEMSEPSFLRAWFGNPHREARDADGRVLRVEDQRVAERKYLTGVGRTLWTTLRIAALGIMLAVVDFALAKGYPARVEYTGAV